MKVFISMPMRGKSTEEIVKTRSQIFKQVKKDFPGSKLELLGQIIEDDCPFKGPDAGIWYLAKSIEIMAEADVVVFAPNWHLASGCRAEKFIAENYGKYHIFK